MNEKTRPVTFTLYGSLTCGYGKEVVIGTYTTHPADAVLTLEQSFTSRVGESAFCPSTVTLEMAFTLTTDPEGKEGEPVYIDE